MCVSVCECVCVCESVCVDSNPRHPWANDPTAILPDKNCLVERKAGEKSVLL